MASVGVELRTQFEEAADRSSREGSLDGAIRRGKTLRRRRAAGYIAAVVGGVMAFSAVGIAISDRTSRRSVGPSQSPRTTEAPAMELGSQDRAALTALDAVLGSMALPRDDGMYPYFGGIELGNGGNYVASFHLMACAAANDCAGAKHFFRVHVAVEGDVGRVVDVQGSLPAADRSAISSFSRTYPEGERRFEVSGAWLRDDGGGQGAAIASYNWRGSVPAPGYRYECTATVLDDTGRVLYEGSDHTVWLPAPDFQELRSGLVGVPVELPPGAASAEVNCDDETKTLAPMPSHGSGPGSTDKNMTTPQSPKPESPKPESRKPESSELEIRIVTPRDGNVVTVGEAIRLRMRTVPEDFEGHIHVYVDDEPPEMIFTTSTVLELDPGRHTIKVEMVDDDHQALGATDMIRILAK